MSENKLAVKQDSKKFSVALQSDAFQKLISDTLGDENRKKFYLLLKWENLLTGRLTKHPECKRTDSGKSYAQFSIAVNRSYVGKSGQKETDFINCVAWGTTAENLAKYQEKGSLILVRGRTSTKQL